MTVPSYWMYEQGGVLAPAIRKYLAGRLLQGDELAVIRTYLRQWIDADVFAGDGLEELRDNIDGIRTSDDLRAWLSRALDFGIDPL